MHILIVPNKPIPTVNDIADDDEALLGHMFIVARDLARQRRHRRERLPPHHQLQPARRAGGLSPAHAPARRRPLGPMLTGTMGTRMKTRRTLAQARPRGLYPPIQPYRTRPPAGLAAARALLRGKRQPRGQAGGVPARRPGRRHEPEDAPLLRPEALPHRAVRPARLRQEPPAREPRRQHDLAPGRRHRGAARAPRHRALAGVRRLLGLDAGAGLCADASASA